MNECNNLCIGVFFNRRLELFGINRVTPTIHHHDRCSTAALDVLFHTTAKHTVLAYDYFIATLHQINKGSLHTSRAWR